MKRAGKTALAATGFVLAVALVGGRIWARLDDRVSPFSAEAALVDFRDAVYYPVVALLDGENPYDRVRILARYPVNATIGLYSPLTLLLHGPWGLLPYRAAELAFVTSSFVLVVLLAAVAWRVRGYAADPASVLGFAAVLVVTRPGHWNLMLGQVALETALATIAALWLARSRPWLAGIALAVTTFKATYGLPLLVLMVARRDTLAVAVGLVGAIVLTAAPFGVIVARAGLGGFVATVLDNYTARVTTPSMTAAHSLFRIDIVALAGRMLGHDPGWAATLALGAAVLAIAAVALRRLAARSDWGARALALEIASLAILLCTYHQQYDAVVLAPLLLMGLPRAPLRRAQLPAALAAVPFVNYLASGVMLTATGMNEATMLLVSSINVVALLAAFAILIGRALSPQAAS